MLLDNSLIHGYLGDGNKIAAISVAKLWTLFSSLLIIASLARAYAASGKSSETIKLLSDLEKRSNSIYSHGSEIAVIYAALGDADQAMNWLEKSYQERFNPGVLLRPGFDSLRSDPRFQDLVRRIGLPH